MKKIKYLLIVVLLLTGCKFYDEYKMPEDAKIDLTEAEFDVYSDHTINDLVDDTNTEILNGDIELKTTKLGKKDTEIEYKFENRTYKYRVNYKVVDKEPPFIMKKEKYVVVNMNDEIDLCESVVRIDNYDRSPKCSIYGDYDLSIPGVYSLKYQVKDKSNNITTEDFTLGVIDNTNPGQGSEEITPTPEVDPEPEEETYSYILWDDFEKTFKTKDTMVGIDVSAWQGQIDFKKVKADGAEFVIIRMAYNSEDDKEIYLDKYFEQNYENAKKVGLKVGVYVYTNASTTEDAIKQAKFIRKHLKKRKLDFPIAYDFENWSGFNSLKMNTHDLLERVNEYKSILKKDGYDVMIYGSKWYLENVWLDNDYTTWMAHYTDQTDYSKPYKLWQHASDGIIDGIEGYVDLDVYYK